MDRAGRRLVGQDGAAQMEGGALIEVTVGHAAWTSTDATAITFGRSKSCTIKMDADRTDERLSRVTGGFRREADHWQLHNDSGRLDLVVALEGGLRSIVAPGAWPLILPHGAQGIVTIQTTRTYSVGFRVAPETGNKHLQPHVGPMTSVEETVTGDMVTVLGLTEPELAMLAALCEPRLRDASAGSWTVPSTKDVCSRLGTTPKRAEDLVDSLARKFAPVVDGLFGDNRGRANTRRVRLADFALRTRCVTVADLRRLPPVAPI
jgi:hypothetical protein